MLTYTSQIGQRDRKPFALVIYHDEVIPFTGLSLPGILVIRSEDFEKGGKWSSSTYRFDLVDGASFISGHNGWNNNTFAEGLKEATGFSRPIETWLDMAEALGVTVVSAQKFLRDWREKAALRLDEVEKKMAEIDDLSSLLDSEVETLSISFGSPTNRQIREGYWTWPVLALLRDEEIGRIESHSGEYVVKGKIRLLSCEHTTGMHGGYISLRVAAPGGTILIRDPSA